MKLSPPYFNPADEDCWDIETGKPGIMQFASAVQVWCMMNFRVDQEISVNDVAKSFDVPATMVAKAVEEHPWMFLSGAEDDYTKMYIQHDGE